MINLLQYILITLIVTLSPVYAEDITPIKKQLTTIKLNHISASDAASVLMSLKDRSVSIRAENNTLHIDGYPDKTKNILPIIEKIDTPPEAFTIEFIASNRKINFNQTQNTYNSSKSLSNTSQSMSIIERQWVTLNTGLTIPVTERTRLPDGTETQSFRYKKISKSYLFKVHEFSGWSVVQLGITEEYLSDDIAGAIEHTKLDTTIVGKTNEWIEVASRKRILNDKNSKTYTTQTRTANHVFLYLKVIKSENQPEIIKSK